MKPYKPNTPPENYYFTNDSTSHLFKSHIDRLLPGKVLVPDDHAGNNSLYAASHGWDTFTFHIDDQALPTISKEVKDHDWSFHMSIGGYALTEYEPESMDLVAFINADIPAFVRPAYFQTLLKTLKKGGLALVETYHTDNRSPDILPELRMNEEMLEKLFRGFSSVVIRKVDEDATLTNGQPAHVYKIQLIGIK